MSSRSQQLPRRSCMTVPGSSARMVAKAAGVKADMIIFDLEDAVAPALKSDARGIVVEGVRSGDWGEQIVGVRVNDWSSTWTLADLREVVAGCSGRLDVVVLPKVEDAGMVRALDLVLAQLEQDADLVPGAIGIEAQIESAHGVQDLAAICGASPRLEAVALGPLDLAASLAMPSESDRGRARFDPIASAMVVAARAAGVQVIDGPFVNIRDLDGLRDDARWAVDLGFDGKWALHPDQVPVLNEEFSPSPEAYERAVRILEAYEASTDAGRGAVLVDGQMVDEASCRIARKIVERGLRSGLDTTSTTEPEAT